MVTPVLKQAVYDTTLGSASAALASMALDTPIGLPGAVVLGATRTISQYFIDKGFDGLGSSSLLSNETKRAVKIAFVVAGLFATSAIAWKALAAAGIALTFKQVVVLRMATGVARHAIAISADLANLAKHMWRGSDYEDINNRSLNFRTNFARAICV